METLELLGTALGLGALAGVNLYLTVFVAGLAIQQHWITLEAPYMELQVLGHPVIIAVAGFLYFLQFFADKVPWVDSLWDLVHSLIRPIGGAMLAVMALGSANPVFDVTVALLAGGVALSTHTLKAGARLIANGSPEPFSNIALSVGEDAAVLGGLALLHLHPVLALAVVILLVALIVWLGPKIARSVRVKLWLAWKKLKSPAGSPSEFEVLPKFLPADADILLHSFRAPGSSAVKWAVPCVSSGSRRLKSNSHGYLVALEEEHDRLHFVGRGWFRKTAHTLNLAGCRTAHEPKFLSENLVLYSVDQRIKEVFLFHRGHRHLVARLVEEIKAQVDAFSAPGTPPAGLMDRSGTPEPPSAPETGTASPGLA